MNTHWSNQASRLLPTVGLVAALGCTNLTTSPPDAGQTRAEKVDQTQYVQRPLSDFLSAQGTTSLFQTPVPDYIGWFNNPPTHFALVDYAGLASKWLQDNGGPSLGTQVSGTVSERPLADGRAEVTVILHTTNALAWVSTADDAINGTLLMGSRAQAILADPANHPPALGGVEFMVVFNNTAPGAPIPDLVDAFILGNAAPGQELIALSIRISAVGPLHAAFGVTEGTPGRLVVTQTGNFRTPGRGATADGFPAERVDLHVIQGKSPGNSH